LCRLLNLKTHCRVSLSRLAPALSRGVALGCSNVHAGQKPGGSIERLTLQCGKSVRVRRYYLGAAIPTVSTNATSAFWISEWPVMNWSAFKLQGVLGLTPVESG